MVCLGSVVQAFPQQCEGEEEKTKELSSDDDEPVPTRISRDLRFDRDSMWYLDLAGGETIPDVRGWRARHTSVC